MTTKKDGGPAFARPYAEAKLLHGRDQYFFAQDGMSLRDWFAGMALQGMLSNQYVTKKSYEEVVTGSYAYADAMLEEREK